MLEAEAWDPSTLVVLPLVVLPLVVLPLLVRTTLGVHHLILDKRFHE